MPQDEPKEAGPRSGALVGLIAAMVVALGLSAIITFSQGPARSSDHVAAGPSLPAQTARRLTSAAMKIARIDGDPRPDSVQVVQTTRGQALTVATPGDFLSRGNRRPVYLVVMHGKFRARDLPAPPGARAPTGSYLSVTLDRHTLRLLDFGLSRHRPAVPLHHFGRVTTLRQVIAVRHVVPRRPHGRFRSSLAMAIM
jgi:hypothetical protein